MDILLAMVITTHHQLNNKKEKSLSGNIQTERCMTFPLAGKQVETDAVF